MALYVGSSYGRRRRQRRSYIISAVVIVVVIIVLFYGYNPFGKGGEEPVEGSIEVAVESEPAAEVVEPEAVVVLPEFSAGPVGEHNEEVAGLIAEAMDCISAKPSRIIDARDRLNEALPMMMNAQQRSVIKQTLSELSGRWLFSRTIFPQDNLCGIYEVKQGDLLSNIGNRFKIPYEILLEINNISSPRSLKSGETIKVIHGPFHARVYRSSFTMDLYLQNTYVRSFSVGLGKPGMETPTGLWIVKADGKLIEPTWTDPMSGKTYESEDPDYPLGSRWIGLEGVKGDAVGRTGFAIHGTKDPQQLGMAGSQGCIRLHNGDAILVYNLLAPTHSRVEIVD